MGGGTTTGVEGRATAVLLGTGTIVSVFGEETAGAEEPGMTPVLAETMVSVEVSKGVVGVETAGTAVLDSTGVVPAVGVVG